MNCSPYNITRTCKNCKNEDIIYLTKREAAFELYNSNAIWNFPCSKCNSTECCSISKSLINLDKYLLLEWAKDVELHLMPQDEELFLAEERYINLLLDIIDNYEILPNKKKLIIEALCIIIYDNSSIANDGDEITQERQLLMDKVVKALIQRKQMVIESTDNIRDYVKEVVFPYLSII